MTDMMTDMALSVYGRFDKLGHDGTPARLGIMGGTFDPIHVGHLRMAEEMREALELNGVLFIPAGDPVFKKDVELTDPESRMRWTADAIADNPFFDASPLEIKRQGDTFTIDTLRELRELYPSNVELVLIVGDDAAGMIDKWRDAEHLSDYARIAVATGRPGDTDQVDLRARLDSIAAGRYDLVPVSALDIASHDIRERYKTGKSTRYLVPSAVERSVNTHRFVPDAVASEDVLSKDFYKARKKDLSERVDDYRFRHSLGVAKTAKALAKQYGVDPKKARLAGILHDWDKAYDDPGIQARVHELGMEDELNPVVVETMPRVIHGMTAARALQRDYPEIPGDILQAISRHTVAAEDMTPLDMVIYIADALEPNRKGEEIERLRELVGTVSLEELFFETYNYWTNLLLRRRAPMFPDTIHIWNTYALRIGRLKGKKPYVRSTKK